MQEQDKEEGLLDEVMDDLEYIYWEGHPGIQPPSKPKPKLKSGDSSVRKRRQEKQASIKQEILQTSLYILIVLCMMFLIVTYVGVRTRVKGTSMMPTLEDGDQLLVDKLTYRFSEPQRFDIVIFPYRYNPKMIYIKRIIGMPGETVYIDEDGNIYINGQILEEDYGMEQIRDAGRAHVEITLGENEYFVMGDNRNNSSDSRDPSVGNISRSEIIGKAFLRIWPISHFGILQHQ